MSATFARLALLALAMGAGACAGVVVEDPFERGVQAYHEGRDRTALFEFDRAIAQNPTAAAHSSRGVVLARMGELAASLRDHDRAVELGPDDPVLHVNRGNSYLLAGAYDRAIADYTRALELRPDYARAHYNRGTARRLAGDARWGDDWLAAAELETDPYEKARVRRQLDPGGIAGPRSPTSPVPAPSALPAPGAPAASSPAGMDARVLATRGLSRALDGDRAGAVADLRAALALERDPGRRARIEGLLQLLSPPHR